jgi:hypothetical protein
MWEDSGRNRLAGIAGGFMGGGSRMRVEGSGMRMLSNVKALLEAREIDATSATDAIIPLSL